MATPQELAQQIADRSAQTAALMADMDRRAREAATARLAPSGDTLAMYEGRFNEVYNPANAQVVAQANAMKNYATGLGDILVRKAREARSGSGSSYVNPYGNYRMPTLEDLLALQGLNFGQKPVAAYEDRNRGVAFAGPYGAVIPSTAPVKPRRDYGSADTQERRLR